MEDINTVLCDAAEHSLKKIISKPRVSHKRKPKWYNESLLTMKKNLEIKHKLFEKYRSDPIIRGNFFSSLKQYRKMRKIRIREHRNEIIDKLDSMLENNPKKYWALLASLISNKDTSSVDSDIQPNQWYDYFRDLNKKQGQSCPELLDKLVEMEHTKIFSELDHIITIKEISNAISSLKNNKASSFDLILNEMLKYGQNFILKGLHRLFNLILSTGNFPTRWAKGIIVPLFKNGSKDDPSNYRGLTIGSNICKLFTKILNTRLNKFLEERNIICLEQIGFTRGMRTSDHMFVLKTLYDKYTQQGSKKLYSCFVDFRKAFDTVRHEELFYKLRVNGISDLFYNVIKNMYANIDLCVKTNTVHTTGNFQSFVGVRQGDNLSLNLFKIFINDLPTIFDASCKPVELEKNSFNCLMYADDVILLSETADGLQNCLSMLEKYCKQWGLEVNINKTKSLVFNKSGRLDPVKFLYNNNTIQNVRSYTYLGVSFSTSGNFKEAKYDLYRKGLKAYFKLRKSFEQYKPKIKTLLHVFDHTIKPVLLYGSEIWGIFGVKKFKKLKDVFFSKLCDDLLSEKLHIKMCKYLLEVPRFSTNIAVMGELGRYPLLLEVFFNMIKYWFRLSKLENCLAADAYIVSKRLHSENKTSWYSCIHEIFEYFNIKENSPNISKEILKSFHFKYNAIWGKRILDNRPDLPHGNKLRTYSLFKNIFCHEDYLKWGNYCQRRLITNFRISSHKLEIERGRYFNVPADQRTCKLCKLSVENEIHFLLECPELHVARQDTLTLIYEHFPNVRDLDNRSKFIWLMSAEDSFIYNKLYILLKDLYILRESKLK